MGWSKDHGTIAKVNGDYAKVQGDVAKREASNLFQLKSDVETATLNASTAAESANAVIEDANTAASNADSAASEAIAQANHAKNEGDRAKAEADRLAGTDVSVLDNKVTNLSDSVNTKFGEVTTQLAQTATKEEVSNALDGSPKGAFPTVADLETAHPNGAQGVFVIEADGHIYSWNGNSWVDRGLYQSQGIADQSVTSVKVAKHTIMEAHLSQPVVYSKGNKNLFDLDQTTDNHWVDFTTGAVASSSNQFASDFIQIKPNTSYTINKQGTYALYDANKTFIIGQGNTNPLYQPVTLSTPNNAYFIRVSNHINNRTTFQLEEGILVTSYEKHYRGGRLFDKSIKKGMLDTSAIEESNIEKRAVGEEALKYLPLETTRGKNIFNKNKVKVDVYIRFDTGKEVANTSYNASDYILIEESTNYAIYKKDQLAFYDADFRYISGIGGIADYQVVTTPVGAKYLRISVADANLNLVQVEKGSVSTIYEEFKEKTNPSELTKNLSYKAKTSYSTLFEQLENPFIKTKVKLVGDSITAGVGGTGYSLTGPFMFKDYRNVDRYENISTATCWANSLKRFLEAKYNKDTFVDLEHKGFEVIERNATQVLNANSYNFFFWSFPNLQQGKPMAKFNFYGDHFSLYHVGQADGGIFELVVDGEVKQTIDSYSATSVFNIETAISGLMLGEHSVEIRSTNNKNASATGKTIRISGLKLPKHVEVKNWGISGIRTLDAYFDRTKLIESTDDIVVIQLGTNDRIPDSSVPKTTPPRSKRLLKVLVDRAKEIGADVYLMAAPPASVASETNPVRAFHMEDVHNYIKKLAEELNLPFISHFQEYYQHIRYRGVTLDSLLADGLHPNDIGYDVMFKKIMQEIGIGLTYDGVPIE
ncbi:MAG: SGNH/GDSL hydrolase family protein [Solibacillus sp.]